MLSIRRKQAVSKDRSATEKSDDASVRRRLSSNVEKSDRSLSSRPSGFSQSNSRRMESLKRRKCNLRYILILLYLTDFSSK